MKKLKVIIIVLLLCSALAAGCLELPDKDDRSSEQYAGDSNEDTDDTQTSNGDTTPQEVVEEGGTPEIMIASAISKPTNIEIQIKNLGDGTARQVYCALIGIDSAPDYSSEELQDFAEYKEALKQVSYNSILEGNFVYDTGYSTAGKENLTISGEFIRQQYIDMIPPKTTIDVEMPVPDKTYAEVLKVTWMTGQEEDLVVY